MGAIYECLTGTIQCIINDNTSDQPVKAGDEFMITDGAIDGLAPGVCFNNIDEVNWYFKPFGIKFKVTERCDL